MSFDYHSSTPTVGGDPALLGPFAFNSRERFFTAAVASSQSAQNAAVTPAPIATTSAAALNTMASSPVNRQVLAMSPNAAWMQLDMACSVGQSVPMHSPNASSMGSVSSPEDSHVHSPGLHSASSSPLEQLQSSPFQPASSAHPHHLPLMAASDWSLSHTAASQSSAELAQFIQTSSALMAYNPYATTAPTAASHTTTAANFQLSALDYLSHPAPPPPTTQATLGGSLQLEQTTFNSMSAGLTSAVSPITPLAADPGHHTQAMSLGMTMAGLQDYEFVDYPGHSRQNSRSSTLDSHSPTGTYVDVLSLSPGSDSSWAAIDPFPRYDASPRVQQPQQQPPQNVHIFNPSQTLRLATTPPETSPTDATPMELSYEDITFPCSPFSQSSDSCQGSAHSQRHRISSTELQLHQQPQSPCHSHTHSHSISSISGLIVSPAAGAATVAPVPIAAVKRRKSPSASSSSSSPASARPASGSGSGSGSGASNSPPAARKATGVRKSPIAKASAKSGIRRTTPPKKEGNPGTSEKRVGRRRGPLLPEQRKQASEIRKLRACLRCKFLKKTCDKGEPCGGCQPSHARLWQVPCTRIDIKEIGYFMKDWKADYERHLDRTVSIYNVKGFSQRETLMWITHGYGFCLPVMVREVYVADNGCFQANWVESHLADQEPIDFEYRTARLDIGQEGLKADALHEYLDKHIDESYEHFIDDHFEGTPFVTELLKTAYRYYVKTQQPAIRKVLKLVLAYNLTMHITMVEQPELIVSDLDEPMEGTIDDEDSKYYGRVVAPVMVNFQIKCALADMWRELQKEVLEALSALYSSVYSGERLKNWPTIFMLASVLLVVWEEMQFDCHYRVPDQAAVNKFCHDMESTPVGVIIGLFHAISQKLPSFTDWDTARHGALLNNNPAVCDAMTEVRQHVQKHESYLRTRQHAEFDRYDFDSLSNKFLSKLVIRAH